MQSLVNNEDAQIIDFALMRRLTKRKRKRGRVPVNALAHEGLFAVLTTLRAANADSLIELFFRKTGVPRRTAMRRLADLVKAGYLERVRVDGTRWVYHLTANALELTPRLQRLGHTTMCVLPPPRQAMYCWLRSSLWASLAKDGYTVGQDGRALHALRRFFVDGLLDQLRVAATAGERDVLNGALRFLRASESLKLPLCDACSRCEWRGVVRDGLARCPSCNGATTKAIVEHRLRCRICKAIASDAGVHTRGVLLHGAKDCGGALREVGVVPYDIAWRRVGDRYEVILLVVDNPTRSVEAQVDELPFVCFGQPPVRVILRSTDPHSRFDRTGKKWAVLGQRRAELMKAFGNKGHADFVIPLDYRPELQAYYR
jgi:hypothetical protein